MRKSTLIAAALMTGVASAALAQAEPQDDKKMQQENAQKAQDEAPKQDKSEKADSKADRGNTEDRAAKSDKGKPDKDEAKAEKKESGQQGPSDKRAHQPASEDKSQDKAEKKSDKEVDKPKQAESNKPEGSDKADKPATEKSAADRKDAKPADDKADAAGKTDKPSEDASKQASDSKDATAGKKSKEEVKSVELSGEKREKVVSSFKSQTTVKEITNVNIDITVGRRLPSDWVYYEVPSVVLVIAPQYRGYRYVYVEGDYVIVDPDSYEVVTIIDAGGVSTASRSGRGGSAECSTSLTISEADRDFIFENVKDRAGKVDIKVDDLRVGFQVPNDIELLTFQNDVTTRISTIDECRYLVVEDRIVLIDPDDDKVVLVIEDR